LLFSEEQQIINSKYTPDAMKTVLLDEDWKEVSFPIDDVNVPTNFKLLWVCGETVWGKSLFSLAPEPKKEEEEAKAEMKE
jgi:hypothetical protein